MSGIITNKSKAEDRVVIIEELHQRYASVIFDLCIRILNDPQEAEDAVQETFVNAFRSYHSFRYGNSHLPWLYRIGTNVCLRFIRTKRRKGTEMLNHPETIPTNFQDVDQQLYIRQVLERVMDDLDERGQEILVAHYISGMDQGQIAASLGISRRAVVKRLTSLRKRFGDLFEQESTHG